MQRIWTKTTFVFDGAGQYVRDEDNSESFIYEGEVALCKGDDTAKASEEASLANQQQQTQYMQQFMDLTQKQYGKQSDIYDKVSSAMQPIIDKGGVGYDPQALASLRTSANDTTSNNYEQARKAIQATQFARGGRDLPSGVDAQVNAGVIAAEAQDKSGQQNQITQADANLKQTNYWNAVNTLDGVASGYNPLGFAGAATGMGNAATGSSGAVANASQVYTASKGPGVGAILGGLAGGALSAAGAAGGFGKLFSSAPKTA